MNQESLGFLEVVVRTGGALPIANAKVNVYEYSVREDGTDGKLIYSVLTDENGKAPKLALYTKNKELSMTPNNDNPFSVYNISVEHDGYYNNKYINVPIFQGITSIQTVDLIPLLENRLPSDDFPDTTERNVYTPNTKL